MALLFHITIALLSLIFTTVTVLLPTRFQMYVAAFLILMTLVSGVYLVLMEPAQLAHTCVMGLVFTGVSLFGMTLAKQRLIAQNS